MQGTKQTLIPSYYKRKGGSDSSDGGQSSEDSEYEPERKSQMFATPMNWTRIKETSNAPFQRVAVYDVEADVNSDKALK